MDGECIGTANKYMKDKSKEELVREMAEIRKQMVELERDQQRLIQQERLSALAKMTGSLAHEFNNALMPIMGFCEILLTSPAILDKKDKAISMLQEIADAAQSARRTIDRLREFYRPPDQTEYTIVNFNELIRSTVSLARSRWKDKLESKGVVLKIQMELKQEPSVSGNESRLGEALSNLILNSIEAMPQGGTITIRSCADNQWVTIEVSDAGAGMTEDVRRVCFEPFFSAKKSGGKGMGLAIVYGIIRQHGGTIDVQSEPGKGTTVEIRLPQQAAK